MPPGSSAIPRLLLVYRLKIFGSIDLIWSQAELNARGTFANPDAAHQSDDRFTAIPQAAGNLENRKGTWGLGLFATHGGSVHYDNPRTLMGLADNTDRRFDYAVIKLMPSICRPHIK